MKLGAEIETGSKMRSAPSVPIVVIIIVVVLYIVSFGPALALVKGSGNHDKYPGWVHITFNYVYYPHLWAASKSKAYEEYGYWWMGIDQR